MKKLLGILLLGSICFAGGNGSIIGSLPQDGGYDSNGSIIIIPSTVFIPDPIFGAVPLDVPVVLPNGKKHGKYPPTILPYFLPPI